MNYKIIIISTLIVSGLISLASDLIYGTKELAQKYMFGIFLSNISDISLYIALTIILISIALGFVRKTVITLDVLKKHISKEKKNE